MEFKEQTLDILENEEETWVNVLSKHGIHTGEIRADRDVLLVPSQEVFNKVSGHKEAVGFATHPTSEKSGYGYGRLVIISIPYSIHIDEGGLSLADDSTNPAGGKVGAYSGWRESVSATYRHEAEHSRAYIARAPGHSSVLSAGFNKIPESPRNVDEYGDISIRERQLLHAKDEGMVDFIATWKGLFFSGVLSRVSTQEEILTAVASNYEKYALYQDATEVVLTDIMSDASNGEAAKPGENALTKYLKAYYTSTGYPGAFMGLS